MKARFYRAEYLTMKKSQPYKRRRQWSSRTFSTASIAECEAEELRERGFPARVVTFEEVEAE